MSRTLSSTRPSWRAAERALRERAWDAVDLFFGSLSPPVFERAKLVLFELALRYSATGRLRDVLLGTDHFPLLSIGPWLLDDLGVTDPSRAEIDRRLLVAGLLSLAAEHVRSRGPGDPSYFDENAELITLFDARAREELRVLATVTGNPDASDDTATAPRWSHAAQRLAATAARIAGRPEILPELRLLVDDLAAAFQVRGELATFEDDLQRGRMTYPIGLGAAEAGLREIGPHDRTRVLGAIVLTDAVGRGADHARERLGRCVERARRMALPSFEAYLGDEVAAFAPLPRSERAERPISKALEMAERFLLSDVTFRGSWEVHREGMFGAPEVASRFAAGLILEIMCAHGHDLGEAVETFISQAARDKFRYYAHPSSATDSDTLGIALRLLRYSRAPQRDRKQLEPAISCLAREVEERRAVPVWLAACDGATSDAPAQLLLGEDCGTVQAHLLLGLAELDLEAYRTTIETAARSLFDRVDRVGLGVNVNYPRLYALRVLLRLAASLRERPLPRDLTELIGGARARLVRELEMQAKAPVGTPQDAALLVGACAWATRQDLLRPSWVDGILRRQGSDGTWPAEPFAAVPTRGRSITAYATVPLTSALCYDALRLVDTPR